MPSGPLIDEQNPFYCPEIPAAVFLKSLRCRTRPMQQSAYMYPSVSQCFTTVLESSFQVAITDDVEEHLGSDWVLGDYFTSGHGWFSSALDVLPPYPADRRSTADQPHQYAAGSGKVTKTRPASAVSINWCGLKRKSSFSDLGAPPKYARSIQSVHESSFDVDLRRKQLCYNEVSSSPRIGVELLGSLQCLENDMISLINKLDAAMPGIRLKDRLWELKSERSQALMDFLARNGYINQASLEILCRCGIQKIVFAPSMFEENGLNIIPQDIYSVLGKEGNYRLLSEISFSGINIRDQDIRYIHHLPSLAVLLLDETGVTNEAVFLLVSLKDTLVKLSLARNVDINEDAIPAILLLSNLSFLSIVDTSIGMNGLRRLAENIHKYDRLMDIEIPFVCEEYVDNIHKQYLFNPVGPLITNADICDRLSYAALKRNLEAHATCNPSILCSGSNREMAQRLSDILKTRRLDILVISMLSGPDLAAASERA